MTGLDAVFLVAVMLLGAIVGSFLNVVIHRLPRGTFFSAGMRSVCAAAGCGRPVVWHDNIPVLGWLVLRGRARCCGARISPRYPLVEALTAGLFALLWLVHPAGQVVVDGAIDGRALLAFALQAFFVASLVANTFIDIDYRILPDVLTKSTLVVGLIGSVLVPGLAGRFGLDGMSASADSLLFSAAGAAAGFALLQGVRLLAKAVFRKDAMGYGDVKLMAAVGAFVGWQLVLVAFFLGCVLGAIVGLVHRAVTGDAYIYFGPFLAMGAVLSLLAGDSMFELIGRFQRWQETSAIAPWVAAATAAASVVVLFILVRRGRRS